MKKIPNFYFFAIIFVTKSFLWCCSGNNGEFNLYKLPNVNTVLFGEKDINKTCWIAEDIGLLINRYVFQSLLPLTVPQNMVNYLEYLEMYLFEVINIKSDMERQILITSLSDAIGGYLRAIALPIVNEGYYEGWIDYKTANRYHSYYKNSMNFLKSDGRSWAKPKRITHLLRPVLPVNVTVKSNTGSFCNNVVLSDDSGVSESGKVQGNKQNNPIISIPFFDDCKEPHALAVPLKQQCLFSLSSNNSVGILMRYYTTSINCFHELCEKQTEAECKNYVVQFNQGFFTWMTKDLIPRLSDSRWYPAFYGCLRIYHTVGSLLNDENVKYSVELQSEHSDTAKHRSHYVLVVIATIGAIILLFWFLGACNCTCLHTIQADRSSSRLSVACNSMCKMKDEVKSKAERNSRTGHTEGEKRPTHCHYSLMRHAPYPNVKDQDKKLSKRNQQPQKELNWFSRARDRSENGSPVRCLRSHENVYPDFDGEVGDQTYYSEYYPYTAAHSVSGSSSSDSESPKQRFLRINGKRASSTF